MESNPSNIQQNSPAQGAAPAGAKLQPDAPAINDSRANVANDDLTQGMAGRELNPEYGDSADPTTEKLGPGGRDDASPLKTDTV
jgi:hypothetical protein